MNAGGGAGVETSNVIPPGFEDRACEPHEPSPSPSKFHGPRNWPSVPTGWRTTSTTYEALDRAARWDPDFVCFPEYVLHRRCTSEEKDATAQLVPGPATDRIGDLAAEHDTYVWLPLFERDGDRRYNALSLLGPDGDVCGTYRKLRPTVGEIEGGTQSGTALPTWETPLGRVAGFVCFALKYPEIGIELARRNVDVFFFSSHLHGRARMARWAREYGFHVVKAHQSTAEMVTPTGETVAANAGRWAGQKPVESLDSGGEARFAFVPLNLDWEVFGRTPGNREAVDRVHGDGRDVVYHDFPDDETFALESRETDATVADIRAEDGLECYRDWLDRNARAVADATDDPGLGFGAAETQSRDDR